MSQLGHLFFFRVINWWQHVFLITPDILQKKLFVDDTLVSVERLFRSFSLNSTLFLLAATRLPLPLRLPLLLWSTLSTWGWPLLPSLSSSFFDIQVVVTLVAQVCECCLVYKVQVFFWPSSLWSHHRHFGEKYWLRDRSWSSVLRFCCCWTKQIFSICS